MENDEKEEKEGEVVAEKAKKPLWKRWLTSKKFWKRFFMLTVVLPILLFTITIAILYWKQDEVVQHLVEDMNADFTGMMEVEDSHISPFETFPYIAIDLEHVKIYEDKTKETEPIVDVEEIFLGFNIFDVMTGNLEIKDIKLKEGRLNLIQHVDGEFNVVKALTAQKEIEDPNEEFHLDLHEIELENIDLRKLNEANNLLVDAYINDADAKFRTTPDHVYVSLDTRLELNLVKDGDTTAIKHKHFDGHTEFDFVNETEVMTIEPSKLKLEGSEFNIEGSIDFKNEALLDLRFYGNKEDFKLFMAMAPEELHPVLARYDNKGEIFFEATVKGKSMNGQKPAIEATFGCHNAFFNNQEAGRKLEDLNFEGHFTTGVNRDASTMAFTLSDFSARPEVGKVTANLTVTNFDDPEIDLQMNSNFELEFLADFLHIDGLQDMHGSIDLSMNFHDIINLDEPEHAIKKLNESYYTELTVKDLGFVESAHNLNVKDVDVHAVMNGHEAVIEYFNVVVNNSDLQITGTISDLPAIIHHTDLEVDTRLKIESKLLDLYQLTGADSTAFDEQIENLSLDLDFKSSARAITESPNLPMGEFFIENLYAKLKNYPHAFHDFHADVIIEEEDFKLVDFKGMIDNSDFLFTGGLKHYDMWFQEHPKGDTKLEFNLTSKMMKLEDLFSYKNENYIPEDYRHEELDDLIIHGYTDLHFNDGLRSSDMYIDKFEAKMKVHPLRFEDFEGRVHYEDEHLVVEDFHGRMGKSDFKTTLHWYLGDDEAVKLRDNHLTLKSNRLDFDELHAYNPPPDDGTPVDHDAGFNIYELPFTDMTFDVDIKHLNYHRYLLHNIKTRFHTTPEHRINFDECSLDAAGGNIKIDGYFNGADPDMIYFSPDMTVTHVDLDKLLFKFENFGQDYLVSENLHGDFSGYITGKVHMHNDLVPKIDDSEIHMDVHVLNGRLENFGLFDYMADYFKNKNLKSVRFDTLDNHIDLTNGVLTIPSMDINSSLGFMHFEGTQNTDMSFEYYLKIPWSVVTKAASSKLFGKKPDEVDPDQVDAIQYADDSKKTRFVHLIITGDPDNYNFKLGKKKKGKKK